MVEIIVENEESDESSGIINWVYYDRDQRPPPKVGPISFSLYGKRSTFPQVSVDGGARYVVKRPIGEAPIRQHVGEELEKITIQGECSPEEASRVDDLSELEAVDVRTHRWSGRAQVDDTSTNSMSKQYRGTWVYKYTIELTEVK